MAWTLILQCLAVVVGMMLVSELLGRLFLNLSEKAEEESKLDS